MQITYNNRWLVVAGGILIQLCLGIIYAWSVFTVPLTNPVVEGGYGFTAAQTAWIFSTGLFTFSIFMILSGRLMRFISARLLTVAGGLLLGGSYIAAGFSGISFPGLLLTIGILGGAGIGLAYAVPLKTGIAWYPDKVGLVSGLAVAGFGFGATFWVKAAGSWFGGGLLHNLSLFNLSGLESTYILYGFILLSLIILGSFFMKMPPEGYSPKGWNPERDALDPAFEKIDLKGKAMLRTPKFKLLFIMFFLSSFAGLMVIYCIKLFGIDALSQIDAGSASSIAGTAMAVYAILNGLGRILYGKVSDILGRKKTLRLMNLLQALMMASLFWLGQTPAGLVFAAAFIGLNYGGAFALFPAATAVYFGKKNVGENYGWVFLAYGFAGIAGPLLAGIVKDSAAGSASIDFWLIPFLAASAACLIAMVLTYFLSIPKVETSPDNSNVPSPIDPSKKLEEEPVTV
ncbi:MAG: MFS transporter [Phyllobacteriaceae bacterium]|nr:MFS transporter [Phyllobacteriaceae bacterium]